jgi:hypothetical protein
MDQHVNINFVLLGVNIATSASCRGGGGHPHPLDNHPLLFDVTILYPALLCDVVFFPSVMALLFGLMSYDVFILYLAFRRDVTFSYPDMQART